MKIVLASASPRRKEILSMVCQDFDVRVASIDESYDGYSDVHSWIQDIARKKTLGVQIADGEAIIGCDTVVYHEGKILGKPRTRDEAISMLTSMSGKAHRVITGICIRTQSRCCTASESTLVYMRELTLAEIEKYVDVYKPYDKAGAYGIQEMAGAFVERIDGDFFNVVGLPLCRLCMLFKEEIGVELI